MESAATPAADLLFSALDADGDGVITREEMREGLAGAAVAPDGGAAESQPEPSEEDEPAEGADEGWFEAAEASSPSWQMGDEAPQWGQRVLEAERSALEELAAADTMELQLESLRRFSPEGAQQQAATTPGHPSSVAGLLGGAGGVALGARANLFGSPPRGEAEEASPPPAEALRVALSADQAARIAAEEALCEERGRAEALQAAMDEAAQRYAESEQARDSELASLREENGKTELEVEDLRRSLVSAEACGVDLEEELLAERQAREELERSLAEERRRLAAVRADAERAEAALARKLEAEQLLASEQQRALAAQDEAQAALRAELERQVANLQRALAEQTQLRTEASAQLASVQQEAAAAAAQAAEAQHRLQSELASARAAHDEALGRAVENEKRIEENARHIAALESRQVSEPEPQPAAVAAPQLVPTGDVGHGTITPDSPIEVMDAKLQDLGRRDPKLAFMLANSPSPKRRGRDAAAPSRAAALELELQTALELEAALSEVSEEREARMAAEARLCEEQGRGTASVEMARAEYQAALDAMKAEADDAARRCAESERLLEAVRREAEPLKLMAVQAAEQSSAAVEVARTAQAAAEQSRDEERGLKEAALQSQTAVQQQLETERNAWRDEQARQSETAKECERTRLVELEKVLAERLGLQQEAAAAAAQAAEAQRRLQSELASARAAHDEALGRAVENEKRIEENARHIAALESRQASEAQDGYRDLSAQHSQLKAQAEALVAAERSARQEIEALRAQYADADAERTALQESLKARGAGMEGMQQAAAAEATRLRDALASAQSSQSSLEREVSAQAHRGERLDEARKKEEQARLAVEQEAGQLRQALEAGEAARKKLLAELAEARRPRPAQAGTAASTGFTPRKNRDDEDFEPVPTRKELNATIELAQKLLANQTAVCEIEQKANSQLNAEMVLVTEQLRKFEATGARWEAATHASSELLRVLAASRRAEDGATPPSQAEIAAHADYLGLDIHRHPQLAWLVEEAIEASLPAGWASSEDSQGQLFYYTTRPGQEPRSTYEHPLDKHFKLLFNILARLDIKEHFASQTFQSGTMMEPVAEE